MIIGFLPGNIKINRKTSFYTSPMIQIICSCFRRKPLTSYVESYKGAGCLFTNGTHVLAGYQPNKKVPIISGIGGSRLPTETNPLDTALRETIEEFFDVKTVDPETIRDIKSEMYVKKTFVNGSYHVFVYSFIDLEAMLYIMKVNNLSSPIYRNFPKSLSDLIFRRSANESSEIRELCILPLECTTLCKSFTNDLRRLQSNGNNSPRPIYGSQEA